MHVRMHTVAVVMAVTALAAARANVEAGRTLGDQHDARVSFEAGAIMSMEGFVNETHRPLYDVTGNTYKQNPEGYDLSDFQIDDGYGLVGFSAEKAWKYVTLEGRVLLMNPEAKAVARRNYYLQVGDISFNGQGYEYLKIPEGTPFTAEFFGVMFEGNLLYTPLTWWIGDRTRVIPWLGLGVYGLGGSYEVDAGPAIGTTVYQNPPQTFVVGGHAEGDAIGALPELVVGGELVFGADDATHFSLQSYLGFFTYSGDSGYFSTANDGYDKHADIDHLHLRVRGAFDFPLSSGHMLTTGVQFDAVDTEAVLKSTADTPEEILARQERYDKEGRIEMQLLTAFVGLAF